MKKNVIVFILFCTFGSVSFASGKCTAVKLASTQKKVGSFMKTFLKSKDPWSDFRNSFANNRECMAIYEASDFGNATIRIFKDRWTGVGQLEKYKTADREFYTFVMSALNDDATSSDDVGFINQLTEKCPSGAKAVCSEIQKTTTSK